MERQTDKASSLLQGKPTEGRQRESESETERQKEIELVSECTKSQVHGNVVPAATFSSAVAATLGQSITN